MNLSTAFMLLTRVIMYVGLFKENTSNKIILHCNVIMKQVLIL